MKNAFALKHPQQMFVLAVLTFDLCLELEYLSIILRDIKELRFDRREENAMPAHSLA